MWHNKTILLATMLSISTAWASGPQTFTYQGQLLDSTGAPVSHNVDLIFQIYNPAGTCLLYEEKYLAQNFLSSGGNFSVQVGSELTNTKRTANDPGLSMAQIFSNQAVAIRSTGAANCSAGYTPSANDNRRLKVSVVGPNGTDVLSPDQILGSSPFAVTAQTLQGKQPGDFIWNTLAGMQAALEALVNGTSSLYVRTDGSNITSPTSANNQRITSVASPLSATDAVNKNYSDTKLGGLAIGSMPSTTGQVLTWNSVLNQWVPQAMTDSSVLAHARVPAATCGANQASSWNGTAWSCVAAGSSNVVGGGAQTYSASTGDIVLTSSSAKVNSITFPEGGTLTLPDATTMSLGGPLYTIMNGSAHHLPVFTSTGEFIGALSGGGSLSDIYLFNNSIPGGDWKSNSYLNNLGVDRVVLSGWNLPTNPSLNSSAIYSLGGNAYITSFWRNSQNYFVAFTVDPSTKTATFGTPVLAGSNQSFHAITAMSSTKALAFFNDGSQVITISGLSLTAETFQPGNTCSNMGNPKYAKLSSSLVACASGSGTSLYISKFDFDGNLGLTRSDWTRPGGVNGWSFMVADILPLSATTAVILTFDSSISPAVLAGTGVDFSGPTFSSGPVQIATGDGSLGMHTTGSSSSGYVVDANNFLLTWSDSTMIKLAKVNVTSGVNLTTSSTQIVAPNTMMGSNSYLFMDSGTLYLLYKDSNSNTHYRKALTGLANTTPTLGAMEKGNDCFYYYRLSKARCFSTEAMMQAPNDYEAKVLFWIGK